MHRNNDLSHLVACGFTALEENGSQGSVQHLSRDYFPIYDGWSSSLLTTSIPSGKMIATLR